MQREVFTQAKKLTLRNPFLKESVEVINNIALLRIDNYYTDEDNNFYYVYDGPKRFNRFDKFKNNNILVATKDFYSLNLLDVSLLNPNSEFLLLFDDEIDEKYRKELEIFLFKRIKNV